jgi:hypothetical protein
MTHCQHEELRQISTLTAETIWTRGADGFHVPDAEINQVLGEDIEWFECVDCGERVEPATAPDGSRVRLHGSE